MKSMRSEMISLKQHDNILKFIVAVYVVFIIAFLLLQSWFALIAYAITFAYILKANAKIRKHLK